MKLILPLILGLSGLCGGLLVGQMLRAPADTAEAAEAQPEKISAAASPHSEFVPLEKQFIVPVVADAHVDAIMIVSISLEVEDGSGSKVGESEPKLRDRFLSVMFRHAESGAFSGVFTAGPAMGDLRGSLLEAAQDVVGSVVRDVLITDLLRQDL